LPDAVGPVAIERVVEPRMSPDQAAERLASFEAALGQVTGTPR